MQSRNRILIILLLASALAGLSVTPLLATDWQIDTDGRVIAVSDIHGAHREFLSLLTGLELIDQEHRWMAGGDHLVIVGDVLDRGEASRDVLELIIRLESEARATGGGVHLLLGNHEIMNLVGDLRYVAPGEFARYADVEDSGKRDSAMTRFRGLEQNAELDEEALLKNFNKTYPPGFFGHHDQLGGNGKLGKWLLDRPVMVRINDTLFAHGGLSQAVKGIKLEAINDLHQQVLRNFVSSREYFIDQGILDAATNFYDQPGLVKEKIEAMAAEGEVPEEHISNGNQLISAYKSEIFDDDALTWYRGNVGCSTAIEKSRLAKLLEGFGVRRLVVGHTPTSSRTIESRFDNMLIRVDTGILNSHYRGQAAAAIISGDNISAFYPNRPGDDSILRQPENVGPRVGNLGDEELERVLAMAPVQSSENRQDKTLRLSIDYEGQPIDAIFSGAKSGRRSSPFVPEVAAYRLDRHLGFELTPATAVRNIEDKNGAITLDLTNLIDEDQRIVRQLGGSAWCPIEDQFNLMYLFDILLHNKGRKKQDMRYLTGNMKLILTGNSSILGSESGAPRYLKSAPIMISEDLKTRLQALDEGTLEELVGDVLDSKRRKALLNRRDWLMKKTL